MATVRRRRGEWVIDYYDENKHRHIFQVESQEEGFERLSKIEGNGRKAPNKKTFKEYGEWWLENCAKVAVKDSTYEEYERALKIHLYPVFGSNPFSNVDRTMVRELIAAKKTKGLSQSSISWHRYAECITRRSRTVCLPSPIRRPGWASSTKSKVANPR